MKRLLGLAATALMIGHASMVLAQTEVTLIAPGGIRSSLEQLLPSFEKKTGIKVKTMGTFGSGEGVKKQAANGDVFDVAVIQPPYPDVLASGNVVTASAKTLASMGIGVAVKKGAPKPDISTPEAVKKMLLAANSVGAPIAGRGPAALAVEQALKQLGIFDQMQSKLKNGGGTVIDVMVAKGEAEIGLAFSSELRDPGVEYVGPLPKELAPRVSYVAFVSAHAKNPAAANKLLAYLTSREAAAIYAAEHMQPGK